MMKLLTNPNEIKNLTIWADELSHRHNKSISYVITKFFEVKKEIRSVEDAKKITELDLYRGSCGDDGR